MTNRSKPSKSKMRCVNLTFQTQSTEGKPRPSNAINDVPNNGFRPHGGNRGSKKHPTNEFSYKKNADYHRKLREDIDKLFDDEAKERKQTPSWVHDVTKETSHSGESPLFKHLSPNKQEQQMEYIRLAQSLLEENRSKMSSRSSTAMPAYHRANSAHQFMEATDLLVSDLDAKLGRPTRTTLLRNRQRVASAPLSSYEIRKEAKKKAQEILDQRSRPMTAAAHKEILFMPSVEKGDTAHAFLTGARYNRAHYLDSKSLTKYGVYMPRDNPMGAFINQKMKTAEAQEETPSAASPTPVDPSSPEIPPQLPMTPAAKGRQAWTETSAVPIQNDGIKMSSRSSHHDLNKACESFSGEQQSLSISGHRLGGLSVPTNTPRLRSACSTGRLTPKSPHTSSLDYSIVTPRETPASRGLPMCVGRSIYQIPFTPELIRNMSLVNQPRSSPVVTARDVEGQLNVDILNVEAEKSEERLDAVLGEGRLPVQEEVIREETEPDNPDEHSEADNLTSGAEAGEESAKKSEDANGTAIPEGGDHSLPNEGEVGGEVEGEVEGEVVDATTNEKLEVESCGQGEEIPDDNVEFFLTEEGGEKLVNGLGDGQGEGDTEGAGEQKTDVLEEEDKVSLVGSEASRESGQETTRETFAPVISVDISKKSTDNLQNQAVDDVDL
ncbi:uncharacterized protein LOC135494628 isoform X2 [Lineus longissimus]|uniref:uncharacterized protein LOC135494628 isoform X2 n=1 Tax=Lineus longissimus TaxID=88925 RepID=UPI002B4F93F0